MMHKLIIGTRGSQLALYQANKVKEALQVEFRSLQVEIQVIHTKGDKILDVALSKIGDKGLFTKEIEVALLNKSIDIAVHSCKDLPTQLPEGLELGAVLERGEFRDALVSLNGKKLNELSAESVVATSSLRRQASLLKLHPAIQLKDIRGNVQTRLQRMNDGYCDAMVMAAAGLQRLKLDHYITEILDPEQFIPAVAQGAIAIEMRSNDPDVQEFVDAINHGATWTAINAERAFLRSLEGGCQVPIGCYSKIEGNTISLTGFVASVDGKVYLKDSVERTAEYPEQCGIDLAAKLVSRGADEILSRIKNSDERK